MKPIVEKTWFYVQTLFKKTQNGLGFLWYLLDRRTGRTKDDYKLLIKQASGNRFPTLKQWKRLPNYLSQSEQLLLKRVFAVMVGVFALLVVNFYWTHSQLIPKSGGSYTEGLVGSPQYVNPVFSWSNDVDRDIIALVFDGLVKQTNSGEYVGDLAESFETNKEKTIYTFHLRKNVKWHDGQDFTANDVIFTVGAIQDPEWRSPLIGQLSGVRVEKTDDYTVQFTLKEPLANALSIMSFGILPEHLWSSVSGASASLNELNKKPVGTGPFVFDTLSKDKKGNVLSMNLIRNPDYYLQKPYLDKIIFKFYGDADSVATALANKNIQGIGTISVVNKDVQATVSKNKDLVFYSLSLPQYVGVFFNGKANDTLKSQQVRQALAYATDKQAVLQAAVGDKGALIEGPILPGYLGFNNETKKYNYDPAAAADLLDKAGWKAQSDGYRKKGSLDLKIKLTTTDSPEYQAAAQIIKESWQRLGIKVELITVSKVRFKQDVIDTRAYEALLFSVISNSSDLTTAWHSRYMSERGSALSILPNKDVDSLLDEARVATDVDSVAKAYTTLQNIFADTVPAIFLYNPIRLYPVSDSIKGLTTKRVSMPADRFIDVENWYTKTKRSFSWNVNNNE